MKAMISIICFGMFAGIGPLSENRPVQVKRVVGLEYPWLANLAKVQGRVELLATISEEGRTQEIQVISGDPLLRESAKANLSRGIFSRCSRADAPCSAKVIFDFIFDGECKSSKCPSEFVADLPDSVTIRTKSGRAIVD